MKFIHLTLVFMFLSAVVAGQVKDPMNQVAKATEFAIPASPAFNMLNENVPSRIQRYASLHDFKVDWSMTNGQSGYSLSPGIALEAQPVWLLLFDRAGAAKYRSASPIARTLSTLSVSMGTNASNDKNWLAWGAKINLYRQNDPLNDPAFLKALDDATLDSRDSFLLKIKDIEKAQIQLRRNDPQYDQQMNALDDSIAAIRYIIQERERQQSHHLAEAREKYIQEHWNASYLDVAFGRLMTYNQTQKAFNKLVNDPVTGRDTMLSFSNNSLELQSQGYGVWVSGGIGVGRNVQLSGMARYGRRPTALANATADMASAGFNIRYGTRRYNFFLEGFLDRTTTTFQQFGEATLSQKTYMMTLGGDWRVSHNVMLTFGIRQTRDFDNGTYLLQPLINVNCLMR